MPVEVVVENNSLNAKQALDFDKELSECRESGRDCGTVVDKYKALSDKQSAETNEKLKSSPLEAQVIDNELVQGGISMADRPGWMGKIPGVDVMTNEEAKAYVKQWNGQVLKNIDTNSPGWTKFAAFASDPENQAAIVSMGLLGKDLIHLAKTTLSSQSYPIALKSLQVGLRDPANIDKLKKDMLNGEFKFSESKGRIAGYVDGQGRYYITEGNHRMVAAQEIYKQTGDASHIEKLIKNGVWTESKNAPAGAVKMPKR